MEDTERIMHASDLIRERMAERKSMLEENLKHERELNAALAEIKTNIAALRGAIQELEELYEEIV